MTLKVNLMFGRPLFIFKPISLSLRRLATEKTTRAYLSRLAPNLDLSALHVTSRSRVQLLGQGGNFRPLDMGMSKRLVFFLSLVITLVNITS